MNASSSLSSLAEPSQDEPVGQAPAASFSASVIAWQRQHGRHALPWQGTQDAYRIWLSEIMLQQTQVAAVIPYYTRFLQRFPEVTSLAQAPLEAVMQHWSGLGYYSRARNLHRCAQQICSEHGGRFPDDPAMLATLPGIGRSTAAAIAAFSYDRRAAILDGNVKRVFCRVFGVEGYPGLRAVEQELWQRAEALLPPAPAPESATRPEATPGRSDIAAYTQGLMDLGATVCTRSRPACGRCPLQARCVALATGRVESLPERKPRKTLPQRQTGMLLIIHQGQVLLEQRPEQGIWGGLLSLPEFALDGAEPSALGLDSVLPRAAQAKLAELGELEGGAFLPAIAHVFTHFRLQILPYHVRLARPRQDQLPPGLAWWQLDEIAAAALPAPVKKLLLQLERQALLPLGD